MTKIAVFLMHFNGGVGMWLLLQIFFDTELASEQRILKFFLGALNLLIAIRLASQPTRGYLTPNEQALVKEKLKVIEDYLKENPNDKKIKKEFERLKKEVGKLEKK